MITTYGKSRITIRALEDRIYILPILRKGTHVFCPDIVSEEEFSIKISGIKYYEVGSPRKMDVEITYRPNVEENALVRLVGGTEKVYLDLLIESTKGRIYNKYTIQGRSWRPKRIPLT